MGPISVAVRRGELVESVHRVHAVAVQNGAVVAEAGDASLVTFLRSAAKPLQALPLARARTDLDDRDLAIASSSHLAGPDALEAVRALCRARGWPSAGYRLAGHPVQEAARTEVAAAVAADPDQLHTAVDGCGVVTFALPLERMAFAFSRLESLDAGARVAAAMRAHAELVRGPGAADTELMRLRPGWTAKGGAEGVLCAAGPDGLGVALKSEDGNGRALAPALAAFLRELGHPIEELAVREIRNSRGENVGCMAAKL